MLPAYMYAARAATHEPRHDVDVVRVARVGVSLGLSHGGSPTRKHHYRITKTHVRIAVLRPLLLYDSLRVPRHPEIEPSGLPTHFFVYGTYI